MDLVIVYKAGSIFHSEAEVFVNPVNCVGVMGAGLAAQFRARYPTNYYMYVEGCRNDQVRIGEMAIHFVSATDKPRYIFNFPTKAHWKNPSKIIYIQTGLLDLVAKVRILRIRSIAIPALGCGHGQLSWKQVEPMIVHAFDDLPSVRVLLYPPL